MNVNVRGHWGADLILHCELPLLIVGGGPVTHAEIAEFSSQTEGVIALDGAADRLLDCGVAPLAVLGDLDSLSARARSEFADRLHYMAEQETTDFEKALIHVEAPAFIGIGLGGGRLDHALAVLNAMARHRKRTVVLADPGNASALVPPSGLDLTLAPGTRLSLMPLGQSVVTATGLRWPLEGAPLAPDGQVSASNEVGPSGQVRIEAQGPVLAVLPRQCFSALWTAVLPAR